MEIMPIRLGEGEDGCHVRRRDLKLTLEDKNG